MKVTIRCGESVASALNERVLATAVEARMVKAGRSSPTVVSANVKYPTDSGVLASAVVKIGRLVRRIKVGPVR